MTDIDELNAKIQTRFGNILEQTILAYGELTLVLPAAHLFDTAKALRDEPAFDFNLLIDVCGVDYLRYGVSEWETESATATGFERGVIENPVKP